jgi:hypothetical protein
MWMAMLTSLGSLGDLDGQVAPLAGATADIPSRRRLIARTISITTAMPDRPDPGGAISRPTVSDVTDVGPARESVRP